MIATVEVARMVGGRACDVKTLGWADAVGPTAPADRNAVPQRTTRRTFPQACPSTMS
jgi:hypothetical protein